MLLPCQDCKKEFSHKAFSCPHCGNKYPSNSSLGLLREMSDLEVKIMLLTGIVDNHLRIHTLVMSGEVKRILLNLTETSFGFRNLTLEEVEPDAEKQAGLKIQMEKAIAREEQGRRRLLQRDKDNKDNKEQEKRLQRSSVIGVAIAAPFTFLLYQFKILDFGYGNWLFMIVLGGIIGNYFSNKVLKK